MIGRTHQSRESSASPSKQNRGAARPKSALQLAIATSPRQTRLAQLKSEMEAGSRARTQMEKPPLLKSGVPVAQLATSIQYDPQTFSLPPESGEAKEVKEVKRTKRARVSAGRQETIGHSMRAYMDPEDPIKGAKTNATEIPLSMKYFADTYPNGTSGWHRGHLLNAKLGGLNIGHNLAPFSNSMNTGAHSDAEEVVKRLMGIGVPCGYNVAYDFAEAPDKSAVTVTLVVEVDPRPRDADDEAELEKRTGLDGIHARMRSVVTGGNVRDRPSSPQPTEVSSLDPDLPLVSGSAYSKLNDRRIEARGWGILRNAKGKGVALTAEQRESVEATLVDTENTVDRDVLLGDDGYAERFEEDEDYWIGLALDWLEQHMPDAKDILLEDAVGDLDPSFPEETIELLLNMFQRGNEKLYTEFMHYYWR